MKKKLNFKNLFLSLGIVIMTLFGACSVYAESEAPSTLRMGYHSYKPPISFPQTFHVKKTTGGKYTYCATYARHMPVTSIKYTKSSKYSDPGINYLLEKGSKVTNDKDYFEIQTAYWIYLMDKGYMKYSPSINTFKSTISKSSSKTAKRIKNLVSQAKAQKSYNQTDPTIKLNSSKVTFSLSSDKKYYVSNKITVKSSESNYKVELVNAPSGTTYSKSGNDIYVKVPVSSVTNAAKTFSIKVTNTKKVYKSYKYNPSSSSYQVMSATYTIDKTAKASKSMSIAVDKILVSKQDITTKQELPGATLQVKDNTGKVVDSWTSTSTPHEMHLTPGSYTLSETIAPNGYDLSTSTIKFNVTNKGITTKVVMYNSKTPEKKSVSISKQDITTKEELPGATLVLKDASGNTIDTWVSEATPHVITDLKQGSYTLSETIAPEGYELTTETVKFDVDENGGTTSPVVMYNTPKKETTYNVIINKLDSSSKNQVAGATLEIRDENDNVVESFVTEDTPYQTSSLKPGTYTLVEKEAPDGYTLTSEKVTFTVKEGSTETVNVTMYNTKTPETPEVPETPETPEEVAVPSTGSNKTLATTVAGLVVVLSGSVLFTKNFKRKHEN